MELHGTINSNSSIEPFQIPELIGLIGDEMGSFPARATGEISWTEHD
jgi:hypothetical protein